MADERAWSMSALPAALDQLLLRAGSAAPSGRVRPLPTAQTDAALDRWLAASGRALGYAGNPRHVRADEVPATLEEEGPYLLVVPAHDEVLAFVRDRRGLCRVVRPDGTDEIVEPDALGYAHPASATDLGTLFAGLAGGERARRRLSKELGAAPCVVVRYELDGGRPLADQLGAQHFGWRLFGYASLAAVQMLVAVGAAWTLGDAALTGVVDLGRVVAWGMLAGSDVPLSYLGATVLGRLSLDFAAVMKRRLLEGALALDEGSWRRQSFADVIARLGEASVVEDANPAELVAVVPALAQLGVAFVLLCRAPFGAVLPVLLVLSVAGMVAAFDVLRRRYRDVSTARLHLTSDLVEKIIGHRTRAVQANRAHLHESEDAALAPYLARAHGVDTLGALLGHWDRAWLAVAGATLALAFVRGASASVLLVSGVGIYFGARAFSSLSSSLGRLSAWLDAWQRIRTIFAAGAARTTPRALLRPDESGLDTVLSSLSFSYGRGRPVLDDATLRIAAGERILVEGPSGGGKTTLSKLLTGELRPSGGSVIVEGVDRFSVADEDWRSIVASSPQFYENYVFSNTFAFNVDPGSLGNSMSPEARDVCRELGLDELVAKMPSQELQMLGESGWQLSHGERSRIFIARSLLQGARVLILDESFGALDPESLLAAMACVRRHARTLLVISHA